MTNCCCLTRMSPICASVYRLHPEEKAREIDGHLQQQLLLQHKHLGKVEDTVHICSLRWQSTFTLEGGSRLTEQQSRGIKSTRSNLVCQVRWGGKHGMECSFVRELPETMGPRYPEERQSVSRLELCGMLHALGVRQPQERIVLVLNSENVHKGVAPK